MRSDTVNLDFARVVWRQRIDNYLASVGMGFNPHVARESRLHLIARLDKLPDEELSRLGIDREGILPFAFRDLLAS